MNPKKNWPPQPPTANHPAAAQPSTLKAAPALPPRAAPPAPRAGVKNVAQSKASTPQPPRTPAAPPVYRPQPTPKCLQMKPAPAQAQTPRATPQGRTPAPPTAAASGAAVQRKTANVIQRDTIEYKSTSINVGDCVRAREGYVYITDTHVYKCFANKVKGRQAIENMDNADREGITVPAYSTFDAVLVTGEGRIPVLVLKMKKIIGKTFYASKPGGAAAFTNHISEITDKTKLTTMKRVLEKAKAEKMTDPQGMITDAGDLVFFDVHLGKGSGGAVDDILGAVNSRLESL